ncbi:follicular epithelium yolk protein subunit [Streptomyces marianii]|uniref:Follicular epithelium yolk protein subunit n=1 Tax=Streptomyces marianii TaxID=1817406 RepID=A0A5R9EG90_9ACTN|nr:follicular epithelium yolk protein subunit [Streptomyces marianii]TLQ47652.1 follicular epithelium yolk protein subunit [Streptomyces marianii]
MTVVTSFRTKVTAGEDEAESIVNAIGEQKHVITDSERDGFGWPWGSITDACAKHMGRRPNGAWIRNPTDHDLYNTYGWQQTTTVLKAVKAEILGINSKPTTVKTATFRNNSSVGGTFNVSIWEEVSNTVSNTWSSTNSFSLEQSISYEIGFLGTGGGGETSMSYTHSWGQSKTESQTVTLGSETGVEVYLEPGQAVKSTLVATRGTMEVKVTYSATVEGRTAMNYNPRHNGHHFWSTGTNTILQAGGLNRSKSFTENLEIGYYSNAEILLEDAKTGELLASLPLDGGPAVKPGETVSFNLSPQARAAGAAEVVAAGTPAEPDHPTA